MFLKLCHSGGDFVMDCIRLCSSFCAYPHLYVIFFFFYIQNSIENDLVCYLQNRLGLDALKPLNLGPIYPD